MRTCSRPGCERMHYALGLCRLDYMRSRRNSSPRLPVLERLARYSHREGDCLIWDRSLNGDGYGQISVNNRRTSVHRAAYIARHGQPPADQPYVIIICGRHACWADEHLRIGTRRDAMDEVRRRGSLHPNHANAHKEHCPQGHSYDGISRKGYRTCSTCHRRQTRESQARARLRRRT